MIIIHVYNRCAPLKCLVTPPRCYPINYSLDPQLVAADRYAYVNIYKINNFILLGSKYIIICFILKMFTLLKGQCMFDVLEWNIVAQGRI